MTGSPSRRQDYRRRALGTGAALLIAGAAAAVGVAVTSQHHAPQPTAAAAGTLGPPPPTTPGRDRPQIPFPAAPVAVQPTAEGPILPASTPVAITIPAIGVRSSLQALGVNPDGTLQVPAAGPLYNQAAWYKYSPTPGQLGPSIIEGHIDSAADGPSVFFQLGALRPGDQIDVTRADHTVAVFTVSGVRQYPKATFPTATVYGHTSFAALRLLTCGGSFDPTSHSYRSNTVVFAALTLAQRPPSHR